MRVTHAFISGVADDPTAAAAGKVLPSQWDDDHVIEGAREEITVDTTFYVDPGGDDVTGDGSIGNPYQTIQRGLDYIMYEITGRGVRVKLKVNDGTYPEAINLGPHQVFAPDDTFASVNIEFSSTATPGNVVIAPPAPASFASGAISVFRSPWSISGGLTITTGGVVSGAAVYDSGYLSLGSDTGASNFAIVFSDAVILAFDIENNGQFAVGGFSGSTISFSSTLGSLVLFDQGATVNFYPQVDVHFDVDPGFAGWAGGQPGAFDGNHGGGAKCIMRNTWSGATPTHSTQSVVSHGNQLVILNTSGFISDADVLLADDGSWYNNRINSISSVKTSSVVLNPEPAVALGAIQNLDGVSSGFQISTQFGWGFTIYESNPPSAFNNAAIAFVKTRGTDPSDTSVALTSGDLIGSFNVYGADGTNYVPSASLSFLVDAATGTNSIPTAFAIATGVNNYGTEGLRVTSDQVVQLSRAFTVGALPAPSGNGGMARVTDGDAALAWGATVVNSGGGATPYLVWDNGTNWTVVGI